LPVCTIQKVVTDGKFWGVQALRGGRCTNVTKSASGDKK